MGRLGYHLPFMLGLDLDMQGQFPPGFTTICYVYNYVRIGYRYFNTNMDVKIPIVGRFKIVYLVK